MLCLTCQNMMPDTSTITRYTAQKIKFSIKDFFSKCDQIRSFLRIWSHLLKKSFTENFISCAVIKICAGTMRNVQKLRPNWEVIFYIEFQVIDLYA